MTACMVHYSFTELRQTVGAVKTAMTGVHHSPKELANIVGDAATFIRARGALAAQPLLSAVHDPLLQKGLQMIVDGQPLRDIEHKLGLEIEGQLAQRMKYSKNSGICRRCGTYHGYYWGHRGPNPGQRIA
ncbi:MAG: hypothetical protein R2857_00040 [Vampirovibrionales bacterium]